MFEFIAIFLAAVYINILRIPRTSSIVTFICQDVYLIGQQSQFAFMYLSTENNVHALMAYLGEMHQSLSYFSAIYDFFWVVSTYQNKEGGFLAKPRFF